MKAPAFWQKRGVLSTLLMPLGECYALGGMARRALARPFRATVPVVCVGNLTAGGTGKTPVALAVAGILKGSGRTPHFLTRGYGGQEEGPLQVVMGQHTADQVGDEPLLLARVAPCWVARDRRRGALAALQGGAEALIMDDGFQNPSLVKDVALVVVDGETGFGNGRVIPAGPLRETIRQGMERADAVVMMGEDRTGVTALCGNKPVLRAGLVADVAAVAALAERPVAAFAGIGRPEKFFAMLRACGVAVQETRAFADHQPYRPADLAPLLSWAEKNNGLVVTTEKDWVRLSEDLRSRIHTVPVSVSWEDPSVLRMLLEQGMGHV